MRVGWCAMVLVLLGRSAAAADVTLCFAATGTTLTGVAADVSRSLFATAGVSVAWQCPEPGADAASRVVVRIALLDQAPGDAPRGVLAVSYPFAGPAKPITVFADRVQALAPAPQFRAALLAYVLAHEVTHVVQGIDRHSAHGVMKARWDHADRDAICAGRLRFDDIDVHLLRQALAAERRRADTAPTPTSAPGTGSHRD